MQLEVQNRLRLDADATNSSGNDLQMIKDTLNAVYADVCITNEVTVAKTAVSPTAGGTYTLASTVVRVKDLQVLVGNVTYRTMIWQPLDQILMYRYAATNSPETGPPLYYCITGQKDLEVYPNFQGNETLNIWAVTAPTALSAVGDVTILPEPYGSRCLIYGALSELADFTKDLLVGMAGYDVKYQQWLMKLRTHLNRSKGVNASKQFESPSPSFIPHDPSTDDRRFR